MSFQCQQSQQNITSNQKFDSQYDSGNAQGLSENNKKQDLICKKCAWKQTNVRKWQWIGCFFKFNMPSQ
jgi:hypothetical protein